MPAANKKTVTQPTCDHTWMDERLCPQNRTNDRPGVRHVCNLYGGHLPDCKCACGAKTKNPYAAKEST